MTERHMQRAIWQQRRNGAVVAVPNFTPPNWHECDVAIVSHAGFFHEYEIKLSRRDFLADQDKWAKHRALQSHDRNGPVSFWYVFDRPTWARVELREVPRWAGVLVPCNDSLSSCWNVEQRPRRLHRHRASAALIRSAYTSLYFRYWAMRNKSIEVTA